MLLTKHHSSKIFIAFPILRFSKFRKRRQKWRKSLLWTNVFRSGVRILTPTLSSWPLRGHTTIKPILWETLFLNQLHDFSLLSKYSFLHPFLKSKFWKKKFFWHQNNQIISNINNKHYTIILLLARKLCYKRPSRINIFPNFNILSSHSWSRFWSPQFSAIFGWALNSGQKQYV